MGDSTYIITGSTFSTFFVPLLMENIPSVVFFLEEHCKILNILFSFVLTGKALFGWIWVLHVCRL